MTGTVLLMALALAENSAAVPVQGPAPHWRGLVVVLVPPIEDDVMRNALARVSGELAAAPFKTVTTPLLPDGDVMAQVESAGSDQSATAAFAIVRDREPGSDRVTIWVSNRVSGTTTMQRMQVQGGGNVDRAAARLAVETVELVRASLAELWPQPRREASPVVEKPAAPAPRGARFALGVGVGLLNDFGDAPMTWAPQIALSYGRPAGVGVRVFASGFGPSTSVSASMGSARFERSIVTLGLVRSFRAERIVQPLIGIAGGINVLAAHGNSSTAGADYDREAVTGLGMASVGVGFALTTRLAILAEADVLMTWPVREVVVGYDTVATFDRPSLFAHAGLLATF